MVIFMKEETMKINESGKIFSEEEKIELYKVYRDAFTDGVDVVLHGKSLDKALTEGCRPYYSEENVKLVKKFLCHIVEYVEKNSKFSKKEIQDFVIKNIIEDID